MHEIAQNCVCNAQKSLAAGALAHTPLGEFTALPTLLSRLGMG